MGARLEDAVASCREEADMAAPGGKRAAEARARTLEPGRPGGPAKCQDRAHRRLSSPFCLKWVHWILTSTTNHNVTNNPQPSTLNSQPQSTIRVSHIKGEERRPQKEDLLQIKIRSSHLLVYVCTAYPNIAKTTQYHKSFAKIPALVLYITIS